MARKLTQGQQATLKRINDGWPVTIINADPSLEEMPHGTEALTILAKHDCMDGAIVRCHRTVKTDTPAGSQVQGFRIDTFGTAVRFI